MKKSMMILFAPVALIGSMLFSASTFAQSPNCAYPSNYGFSNSTHGINHRQDNEHSRIRQGLYSGQLTQAEATRLKAEQRNIELQKLNAKRDGFVTPAERARIRAEQERA